MKAYKSNDLINALRRIIKYGKSEMSIDLFLKYICSDEAYVRRCFHSLAVAELVSRLAPHERKDEWYIAGLLHEFPDRPFSSGEKNPVIARALLTRAGMQPDIIFSIEQYGRTQEPTRWTPLMVALNYADTHIDGKGNIFTSKECCALRSGRTECNACMYARYFMSASGMADTAEKTAAALRKELMEADERREPKGKEERDGIQNKRRVEERSEKAASFAAD